MDKNLFELKLLFEYYLPIGLLVLIAIGYIFLLLISWVIDKFNRKGR